MYRLLDHLIVNSSKRFNAIHSPFVTLYRKPSVLESTATFKLQFSHIEKKRLKTRGQNI